MAAYQENTLASVRISFSALALLVCVVYPVATLTQYTFFFAAIAASAYVALLLFVVRGRAIVSGLIRAWPLYAFAILALLSSLWADYPSETFPRAVILTCYIWVFMIAALAFENDSRNWLYILVTIIPYICLAAFAAVFFAFGSIRVSSNMMEAAVGSFSNVAPALTLLCLPYLLFLYKMFPAARVILTGSIFSSISVILLSQSRGAYLLTAVALLLCVIFLGDQANAGSRIVTTLKWLIVLGGILLTIILVFGYDNTFGLVVERFQSSQLLSALQYGAASSEEPDYARTVMYLEGFRAIKDNWLTGIGFGGLGAHIEALYGFRIVSHNLLISTLGELGILGFLFFTWLALTAIKRVWVARRSYDDQFMTIEYYFYSATLIALIVGLLFAQVRPQLQNPLFYVVLAGAITALPHFSKRKASY